MKKKIRRHPFNMVEIALAMAIIAIGLSGILVLFPVGINASKSAIADNNLADIAEYIMGYLQAGFNAEWIYNAEHPTTPKDDFSKNWKNDNNAGKEKITLDSDGNAAGFKKLPDSSGKENFSNLLVCNGDSRTFLFRQMTNNVVDFAAVVRVWEEDINFRVPRILDATESPEDSDNKTGVTMVLSGSENDISKYARNLCLEISWPVELPYAEREKRVFRLEFFNQAYELPTTP